MAAELRPLLNRTDVLVIDVETTGFGARAEVLAVAVIDTTGQVPASDAHNALVDVRTTLAVVRAIADDT